MTFPPSSSQRVAIIDLGTNTFHLLIAEVGNGRSVLIHREKQPVKIGLGGINQRIITVQAIDRAMKCLLQFQRTLRDWQVARTIAIGTSALRNASNGRAVLQSIQQETGIDVKIISGDQEATYIYQGVRSALDLGHEPSLIMDIGGGSVEFIIGNSKEILWKQSVETGAQRLLELYHRHDPILPEELTLLDQHFDTALAHVKEGISQFKPKVLVGSSGTFDTLSEIYCIRQGIHTIDQASETPLTVNAFKEIHQQLLSSNREQRMKIPGMIEMRVDMIVVASSLVDYLIRNFGFSSIRVSSYSLKEGVLAGLVVGST